MWMNDKPLHMRAIVLVEDGRDVGYVTEDSTAVYRGSNPFWYAYAHDINTEGLSDPTVTEDNSAKVIEDDGESGRSRGMSVETGITGDLLLDRVERTVEGMEFGDYDAETEPRRVDDFDDGTLELPEEPLVDVNPFELKGGDRSNHPDLPENIMDSTAFTGA